MLASALCLYREFVEISLFRKLGLSRSVCTFWISSLAVSNFSEPPFLHLEDGISFHNEGENIWAQLYYSGYKMGAGLVVNNHHCQSFDIWQLQMITVAHMPFP